MNIFYFMGFILKKELMILAISLALNPFAFAGSGHKHSHGEGHLEVAIDQTTVTLQLTLPLDVAVGFERAPKNDNEKAALVAAEKAFNDSATLWTLTPAAQCRIESSKIVMPTLGGTHSDLTAKYIYRCSSLGSLKSIETSMFKQLTRLYRLEAKRVGPSGQGAQRLTPKKPILTW